MPAKNATDTLASLTSFDWFLVIIVALSVVRAFRRGIIRVLFSLAGLVAGVLLASWNYVQLAAWLHTWVTSFAAAEVIAFLLLLGLVMAAFSLVAGVARKTASAVGLGFFDRLLGAAFGLLRGMLLGAAILMAITAFVPDSSWVENSRLAPYFLAGSHGLSFVVPRQLQEQMAVGRAHLLQQTPELLKHGH